MSESIEGIITEFIVDEFTDGDCEIHPDEDLFEEGILDSMSFMRLLEFFEVRFDVQVPMVDITMDRFNTISRAVAHLRSQGATV